MKKNEYRETGHDADAPFVINPTQLPYPSALHEILYDEGGTPCDYRYLHVNAAFEKLLGLEAKSIIGRTVLEIMPQTESYWISTYATVAENGIPARCENFARELGRYFDVFAFSPEPGRLVTIFSDVTKRKLVEEKLVESEQKYRILFENSRTGNVLIDQQTGYIVDCNEAFEKITGRTLAELRELHIWDIRPPEKVEEAKRTFFEVSHIGSGGSDTLEYLKPDGTPVYSDFVTNTITINNHPYLLSVVLDVTNQKKAEVALQASEERFRMLTLHAPVGIFVADEQGSCLYTNKRWSEISGISAAEAMGSGWMTSLHPDDKVYVKNIWRKIVQEQSYFALKFRFQHKNGHTIWVYGTASPLKDAGGTIYGYVGTNIDISDLKRTENQLRASQAELARQRDNFKKTNTTLEYLLRNLENEKKEQQKAIAADITALVYPYLAKLSNSGLTEKQKKYLHILEANIKDITAPNLRAAAALKFKLTVVELQVASMVAKGLTSKEIGEFLHISHRTAEKHRRNIRKKCGLTNSKINLRTLLASLEL
ncbi:MAG: PAS domain S-box protein [Desulfobulbaceae bacterium]|nr:PAS domain S-box protein [Desulfobulbaceae bacterium]